MIIYLHRANTIGMIQKAITLKKEGINMGVEIDIRTFNGIAFLSHDPICTEVEVIPASEALQLCEQYMLPTILDFKETGIVDRVAYNCKTPELYYGVDLIFPDQLWCKQNRIIQTLSRISKYEWIQETDGYWMDYMETAVDLDDYQNDICAKSTLVSPELHKKTLQPTFVSKAQDKGFFGVCTDHPGSWIEKSKWL